jgi:purine-binding chemotaxis protein CheW
MPERQQLCTFLVNNLLLGLELEKVQEVLNYQEMTPVPLAPPVVAGLINLRGNIVTAIDLRKRLELEDRPSELLPTNVVLGEDMGSVSLLADEIGDVVEVDQDSFEPRPETLEGVARHLIKGAYKLKNRLLLVLDTESLLKLDWEVEA